MCVRFTANARQSSDEALGRRAVDKAKPPALQRAAANFQQVIQQLLNFRAPLWVGLVDLAGLLDRTVTHGVKLVEVGALFA